MIYSTQLVQPTTTANLNVQCSTDQKLLQLGKRLYSNIGPLIILACKLGASSIAIAIRDKHLIPAKSAITAWFSGYNTTQLTPKKP